MNLIQSKIARIKIKGKDYDRKRWELMIEKSEMFGQNAHAHFKDSHPGIYSYYCGMEGEYRRRAEWYLNRMRMKRQMPI